MIYGSFVQEVSFLQTPTIESPYELLEMSANYQYDMSILFAESVEYTVLNESVGVSAFIAILIKILKKFGVVIAGVIAAFIAFITKKNNEASQTKKEAESYLPKAEEFFTKDIEVDERDDEEKQQVKDYNEREKAKQQEREREEQERERKRKKFREDNKDKRIITKDTEITIEYTDFSSLFERLEIDDTPIKDLGSLISEYESFVKKYCSEWLDFSQEEIENMDHKSTSKKFGDQYERYAKLMADYQSNVIVSCNTILTGGKDNYFGKVMKSFTNRSSSKDLDGSKIADITREAIDDIKKYRQLAPKAKFTTLYSKWRSNFYDEFEKKNVLIKKYTEELNGVNKRTQSCIKKMIADLEAINKIADDTYDKFRRIGRVNLSDEEFNRLDDRDYTAKEMNKIAARFGRISGEEARKIKTPINAIASMGENIQSTIYGVSKIMNAAVAEVSYCTSQLLVQKTKVLKEIKNIVVEPKF